MKQEKGITLVALILTVVLLLIFASVSIKTGSQSIEETRLKGFYMQLEIIQKRIDDIAATNESYVDGTGNIIYLKEQGKALNEEQITSLENILSIENITASTSNFRYFTIQDLESQLDLTEIEYNVYIDFDNRIVVAADGITIGDKIYYVLENKTYFVEEDNTKNTGTIEALNYNITQYNGNLYKVVITPSNIIGDLDGTGYVKYKKTTTKYWETSNNNEIILEISVEYNLIYIDSNNNKIEKTIKIEEDTQGNLNVTEI